MVIFMLVSPNTLPIMAVTRPQSSLSRPHPIRGIHSSLTPLQTQCDFIASSDERNDS